MPLYQAEAWPGEDSPGQTRWQWAVTTSQAQEMQTWDSEWWRSLPTLCHQAEHACHSGWYTRILLSQLYRTVLLGGLHFARNNRDCNFDLTLVCSHGHMGKGKLSPPLPTHLNKGQSQSPSKLYTLGWKSISTRESNYCLHSHQKHDVSLDSLLCAVQAISFNMICLGELVEKQILFSLVKPLYTASYKYKNTAREDTKQPQPQPWNKKKHFVFYKIFYDTRL